MPKKIKKVYLDYAAATPVAPEVVSLVSKISTEFFGNPSSVHLFGLKAKEILEEARRKIAGELSVKSNEIIFTGSGTESVNLAVLGAARFLKRGHIVTTNIEHMSVLRACRQLEREGFKVTYVAVEKNGIVDPQKIIQAVRPDTILISVQHANNEVGTVQPVKEIAGKLKTIDKSAARPTLDPRLFAREFSSRRVADLFVPLFHTDACQAAGFLPIQPHNLGVDLLSLNGAKIYGPKGVACLYKKASVDLEPLIYGGSQEFGLRAGTENIALAAGLALALEIAGRKRKTESARLKGLRDWLIQEVLAKIPNSKLNGDAKNRLPNNANFSFKGVDGEMLMLVLSQKGVAVSTGSACTTSETGVSHVIKAIGGNRKWGNIRISLGKETTKKDLDYFSETLKKEIKKLVVSPH